MRRILATFRIQGLMGQMTPELRQQMRQEMLGQMGEILTKHGKALKERAKAADK